MQIKVKVIIFKDPNSPVIGPGPLRLLEKIKELKSINQAAKNMNLSYVKALNMLNKLEENLEHKILVRRRGGNERGGAELTPFAEAYIENYRSLEQKINRFSEKTFQTFLEQTE